MAKYVVKLTGADESYWYGDDWKDYVCEDFDENVVIIGDRDHDAIEEASWWKDAKDIIDEAYHSSDAAELIDYHGREYSHDKLQEIFEMVRDADDEEDPEFIMKVAEVLDPWLHLEYGGFRDGRGYSVDVVYVADAVDLGILEDWYSGNIYEIELYDVSDKAFDDYEDDDDIDWAEELRYESPDEVTTISDTEYWRIPRVHGDPDFIEYLGLPKDSEVIVIEEF